MRKLIPVGLALFIGGCNAAPAVAPEPISTLTPFLAPTTVSTVETVPTLVGMPESTPQPATEFINLPVDVVTDVELFYYDRWMRIRQALTIQNTSGDVWEELVFNTGIQIVPGAFFLDETAVAIDDTVTKVSPEFDAIEETMLHLTLPRPVEPGETIAVEMRFRVLIPPVAPTSWPPEGTTGWTFDLIQAGDFYPALVPYADGTGWQTWRYHPVGDPTFYPLVNHRLTVTVDSGIVVAGGGLVMQDGNTWVFDIPQARGIAFLASNNYAVIEGEADGIPVYSYYLRDHYVAGQDALGIAEDAIRLFNELYGPYPYDSLTVVENGFFGGMEYSALISVTDYAYTTYTGETDSLLHMLISHEVAHQWWYGAVGNDQVHEAWLDEALAFYSEYLFMERYYEGDPNFWWDIRVDRFNPQGPVNATIYMYADSPSFILWMYGQAARFMRDLREMMGDEAFFAFLQDYYRTYQWQTVTGDDFFAVLERHTQDVDISPLITRYFEEIEGDGVTDADS